MALSKSEKEVNEILIEAFTAVANISIANTDDAPKALHIFWHDTLLETGSITPLEKELKSWEKAFSKKSKSARIAVLAKLTTHIKTNISAGIKLALGATGVEKFAQEIDRFKAQIEMVTEILSQKIEEIIEPSLFLQILRWMKINHDSPSTLPNNPPLKKTLRITDQVSPLKIKMRLLLNQATNTLDSSKEAKNQKISQPTPNKIRKSYASFFDRFRCIPQNQTDCSTDAGSPPVPTPKHAIENPISPKILDDSILITYLEPTRKFTQLDQTKPNTKDIGKRLQDYIASPLIDHTTFPPDEKTVMQNTESITTIIELQKIYLRELFENLCALDTHLATNKDDLKSGTLRELLQEQQSHFNNKVENTEKNLKDLKNDFKKASAHKIAKENYKKQLAQIMETSQRLAIATLNRREIKNPFGHFLATIGMFRNATPRDAILKIKKLIAEEGFTNLNLDKGLWGTKEGTLVTFLEKFEHYEKNFEKFEQILSSIKSLAKEISNKRPNIKNIKNLLKIIYLSVDTNENSKPKQAFDRIMALDNAKGFESLFGGFNHLKNQGYIDEHQTLRTFFTAVDTTVNNATGLLQRLWRWFLEFIGWEKYDIDDSPKIDPRLSLPMQGKWEEKYSIETKYTNLSGTPKSGNPFVVRTSNPFSA